jgi:methylglyoxal synthase
MERIRAGLAPDDAADRFHAIPSQTLALIAHDALKPQMASFVDNHFELLSRFAHRVSTGTAGRNLNEQAWARGWPQGRLWTECCRSGPMGGDAQIANLIFERRCDRLFFFEDPHVARQHEADIQLLERAVTAVTNDVVCIASSPRGQALGGNDGKARETPSMPCMGASFSQELQACLARFDLQYCRVAVAANVVFQLVNRKLLLGDQVLDKVANLHHADQQSAIDNRKMTYPIFRHERHAFVRCLIQANVADGFRHDLTDRRLF